MKTILEIVHAIKALHPYAVIVDIHVEHRNYSISVTSPDPVALKADLDAARRLNGGWKDDEKEREQ